MNPCSRRPCITPNSPAIVIDECWSARNSDLASSYRLLLSVLASEAVSQKAYLLVHCGSDQPTLRSELKRQGFLPKFQVTRYKVLSRFRRDLVFCT